MKIRNDYVSNSSSSSFIIAYDKKFFGDLEDFVSHIEGYETRLIDIDDYFDGWGDDEFMNNLKKKVEEAKNNKKTIAAFALDYDKDCLVGLLRQINEQNGGNKLEVIYDGSCE